MPRQSRRKLSDRSVGEAQVCVYLPHGSEAAGPRNPEGKKTKQNKKVTDKKYVSDNTRGGPWSSPSNPRAGPQDLADRPV